MRPGEYMMDITGKINNIIIIKCFIYSEGLGHKLYQNRLTFMQALIQVKPEASRLRLYLLQISYQSWTGSTNLTFPLFDIAH
jgi:hypothetical protein